VKEMTKKHSFLLHTLGVVSLFTMVFFLSAATSAAETYYVSPSGTASWSQCVNSNTPCSAATGLANAKAGDVVLFRGGTYKTPSTSSSGYTPAFRPSNSGSAGSPITFKAYSGEIPFIDNGINTGKQTVASFGVYRHDYIVWDGFHTKAVADLNNVSKGVIIYNANHCVIRNCVIEGLSNASADNNSAIRVEVAESLLIENNKIFNSTGSSINSAGITSYKSHYMVVRNNDIFNCTVGVYDKNDGQFNEYYFNHISAGMQGIYINVKWVACVGSKVYRNIIRNVSAGWSISIDHAGEQSGSADKFMFYNNTIYGSDNGISTDEPSVTNTEIFNNMVVNTSRPYRLYSGTYAYYDNNTTAGNFINPGGSNSEDYKRSSYPSDGRGGGYPSVMGAYVTGDEVIGYVPGGVDSGDSKPAAPQDFIKVSLK
jgi:hypothetical protein